MENQDRPMHVLLVEDNPTDAELCIRTLEKHHLANEVVWVKDGAEALDFIFGEGAYEGRPVDPLPSVILLDLRLPKVDGLEVLERVKGDQRTRTIPVVAFTSSKENPDISACYRLGVNSFISKPVTFEAFAETTTRVGMYWLLINRPPRPGGAADPRDRAAVSRLPQ